MVFKGLIMQVAQVSLMVAQPAVWLRNRGERIVEIL